MRYVEQVDPEMAAILRNEIDRQRYGLELIPSENIVSLAVLAALGSVMTNKYSEGYPHKRYYGGNTYIDMAEDLAIERAKQLFGAEHVNVQPYSGSPANIAVYTGLLQFGDTIMGMNLAHGGHLTHGHPVNFSGRAYRFVQYGVDPVTHRINYDQMRETALKERPKMIISGATAYPREIDFKAFHDVAQEVGAISMADIAHIAGLIVGGVHQSPFPFTDVVTTTTHKTLRGPRGAMILCKEAFAKDIDRAVFPGLQGGPHDHVNAAKAVAFKEAMQPSFKEYARQIVLNARALAEELLHQGFDLISGGTDNHLILIDLTRKGVPGKTAEAALDKARITCNKNMVPFDTRTPFNPSGIRIGTPALTTRGMKEPEMKKVGQWMAEVINHIDDESVCARVGSEIRELCTHFPIYAELG